jgi:hypothetical protein
MVDASRIFILDGSDYMAQALLAEWRSIATGKTQLEFDLRLGACGPDLCHLGDLVALLISHMGLRGEGRLLALGLKLIAAFTNWLADCLPRLQENMLHRIERSQVYQKHVLCSS